VKVADALASTVLHKSRLVAGQHGLGREIRWVHIVDMPDILPWVRAGQLLLTTGYAWPRDDVEQRALVRALAERELAAIGLAVPRFFDRFPRALCDEADRLDLPLLEIPWEIPFAQITEELHMVILAEQSRVIEQSELIHRSLTRAALESNSLQDLAMTLGDLINRSVTFEDADGNVLGFHSVEGTEDSVRLATLRQGHSPPELTAYLEGMGYTDQINRASEPMRIPAIPELGLTGRIVCPIRLKGEMVGQVWIIEGTGPLSDLDLRAAENAAIVAALQIAHQRALASLETRVGYSFLDSLLEARFEATPQSLERARLQGFDLDGQYRVGLLVIDEPVPLSREGLLRRERLAERLRKALQGQGGPALQTVSLNQILFLLPAACDGARIWEALAQPGVGFGLSRAYCGIPGVRQGYLEAQAMLPHLRYGSFQPYEALLLPRVLLGEPEARAAFLEETFGRLQRCRNGEMLIETLVAFARSDFRLKRTAQQLHIHPKSLRYRLQRAIELSGIDFDTADTRFRLQLAAHLLSLQAESIPPG
jgi:purine catabolism regulator